MKLSSYMDTTLALVNIEASDRFDAIDKILKKAAKYDSGINKNIDIIKDGVLKRENEISTAMGKNIAIPHTRLENFDDVVVIIASLKEAIISKTADGKEDEVKVMFMIIAGQTKNKLMLKLMSGLIKMAMKSDVVERIYREKNYNNIVEIIKENDIEITNRILAEDVMDSEIEPLTLTTTLEEAATRFVIENRRGIPVVDNKGRFIGEITQRELIEYGMPKYTSLMSDLSFMTVGEPFEEYFKNEKSVTVEELYRDNPVVVDRKASIMEVSFLMVTQGNTRIYVVEDGKFYGLILRADIIKKVLHI